MLRLGSFLLALWVSAAGAQTIQPTGGGGVPSSIPSGTTFTGCGTPNGVFYNSGNTIVCAANLATDNTNTFINSGGLFFGSSAVTGNPQFRQNGVNVDLRDGLNSVYRSLQLFGLSSVSSITVGGNMVVADLFNMQWSTRANMRSPVNGLVAVGTNGAAAPGAIQAGNSAITFEGGALFLDKITAAGTSPGAGAVKIIAVCGTNAGTAKLVAYAGTSSTGVTITDNIGTGVTGC